MPFASQVLIFPLLHLLLLIKAPDGSPISPNLQSRNQNEVKPFRGSEESTEDTSCHLGGRNYVHGDHVTHSDPCETCMCFRGDVLCWRMECPPTGMPTGCREVKVDDRCCPVYECPPSSRRTTSSFIRPNVTQATPIATDTGNGCHLGGSYHPSGAVIPSATGPCLECRCGDASRVVCAPRPCDGSPQKQTDAFEGREEKPIVKINQLRPTDLRDRRFLP